MPKVPMGLRSPPVLDLVNHQPACMPIGRGSLQCMSRAVPNLKIFIETLMKAWPCVIMAARGLTPPGGHYMLATPLPTAHYKPGMEQAHNICTLSSNQVDYNIHEY